MLEISAGDTAWVLASAALVLLMTPGLAFFYGGMVRAKGVLNMMMMSFISMGTIGVLWVLFGYSMAFGNSIGFEVGASRPEGPTFFGLLGNRWHMQHLLDSGYRHADTVTAADAERAMALAARYRGWQEAEDDALSPR